MCKEKGERDDSTMIEVKLFSLNFISSHFWLERMASVCWETALHEVSELPGVKMEKIPYTKVAFHMSSCTSWNAAISLVVLSFAHRVVHEN
jgi:hypothetical protein